jgi:hypothetical protein
LHGYLAKKSEIIDPGTGDKEGRARLKHPI